MLGGLSRGILAQESVSSSEQRKRVAESFVSRSPSKSRFGAINLGNVRKRECQKQITGDVAVSRRYPAGLHHGII